MFIVPKIPTYYFVAEGENLYLKLVEQLNKDFNLANEAVPMSTALKIQLHEKLPLFSIQVC
jgi:hypothetical protein